MSLLVMATAYCSCGGAFGVTGMACGTWSSCAATRSRFGSRDNTPSHWRNAGIVLAIFDITRIMSIIQPVGAIAVKRTMNRPAARVGAVPGRRRRVRNGDPCSLSGGIARRHGRPCSTIDGFCLYGACEHHGFGKCKLAGGIEPIVKNGNGAGYPEIEYAISPTVKLHVSSAVVTEHEVGAIRRKNGCVGIGLGKRHLVGYALR